jgi:hypothetical protein
MIRLEPVVGRLINRAQTTFI